MLSYCVDAIVPGLEGNSYNPPVNSHFIKCIIPVRLALPFSSREGEAPHSIGLYNDGAPSAPSFSSTIALDIWRNGHFYVGKWAQRLLYLRSVLFARS